MDFNDTPELATFRAEARAWLEANAELRTDKLHMGMEGEKAFQEAKQWYKKKAEAGLSCLTWPKEYGGAGLTSLHEVVCSQEVEQIRTRDTQLVIWIRNRGQDIMHYAE